MNTATEKRASFKAYFVGLGYIMAFAVVVSCGAGGGAGSRGDPVGPAFAEITVFPSVIDSGDRTDVEVFIDQIVEDAIAVKIGFPAGLQYVTESAMYEVGGELYDAGPDAAGAGTDVSFVVFYIEPEDLLGGEESFFIHLQLVGVSDVADGRVGVDIDIDDPLVDNDEEFDPATPLYDAQDDDDIRVGQVAASSSSSSSGG
ncbi:MAG: hypothetical protein KDD69_17865 [Bdellovibrionales bacterium]|nr:hypothetical protein [Bdellovibrionales bacterium]